MRKKTNGLSFDATQDGQAITAVEGIEQKGRSEGQGFSSGRARRRHNERCESETGMKLTGWRCLMVHSTRMRLSRRPTPSLTLPLLALKPRVQTMYKTSFFAAIPEIVAFASSTSCRR
jgi:hypothetical protein